jgi:hypothetical protein
MPDKPTASTTTTTDSAHKDADKGVYTRRPHCAHGVCSREEAVAAVLRVSGH